MASLCRALVAWRGGLFLTEGETGVLSVCSLFFNGGGSACEWICVYTHSRTHTHTAHGVLRCEHGPRQGWDEIPGGLNLSLRVRDSRGTKLEFASSRFQRD